MSERATAYHEAGHAVARKWLGLSVRRVTIVGDDEAHGRTVHYPIGEWFRPDIEVDGRVRRRIEHEVMSGWAGTLAEERLGERSDDELREGAARDIQRITDLVLYATGSDYEARSTTSGFGAGPKDSSPSRSSGGPSRASRERC